jgi:probable HAF family extracellular repeat protein
LAHTKVICLPILCCLKLCILMFFSWVFVMATGNDLNGLTVVDSAATSASGSLGVPSALLAGQTYYGQSSDDVVRLGNGDNRVFAGEGFNAVFTGRGNDIIYAGAGRDIIEAGAGHNTVFAGEGINLITSGKGDDLIYGGASADFINAGDGENKIYAGEGNNVILCGGGNDLVYAGVGNDRILTGAGNDTIYAGGGNNVINAGTGNDKVFVGSGMDKVILESGSGSVTIIGFDSNSDKLRLGDSLNGKVLTFTRRGNDTLVKSGSDLLATLKDVSNGSAALIDVSSLYRYSVTDLGSLSTNPNGSINASSINDFGQVVGRYDTGATFTNRNATTGIVNDNNLVRQGFIWENDQQVGLTSTGTKIGQSELGASDGAVVTMLTPNVNTITNLGVILGTGDEVRQPTPKATDRALLWKKDGAVYELSINDFGAVESYFFDGNNRNQISGRNIDADGVDTPLFWENRQVSRLATLGGDGGTARGINSKGTVVGYLDKDGLANNTSVNTAAIWKKGNDGSFELTNLGTFGFDQATLRDLNDAGTIIGVGTNSIASATTSSPFMVRSGQLVNLGSLGGRTGSTNGINELGQVVGASQIASGMNHAYIYEGSGAITDLNSLISTPITYNGAVVTLTNAASINNFGDIVAIGTYSYKNAAGTNLTGTRSYVLKAI